MYPVILKLLSYIYYKQFVLYWKEFNATLQIDGVPHNFADANGNDGRIWTYNSSTDDWTLIGRKVMCTKMLHRSPSGRFAGFVNNFLRVPLACLGSREAA